MMVANDCFLFFIEYFQIHGMEHTTTHLAIHGENVAPAQ